MAAQETIVRHVVRIPGSFRDPAGHVYTDNGQLFRTVNSAYAPHYEYLQSSGLLADLSAKGWMIDFEEDRVSRVATAWKTIRVRRIPFISYPYEWSFSQLRAAALLTLDIQEAAAAKRHLRALKRLREVWSSRPLPPIPRSFQMRISSWADQVEVALLVQRQQQISPAARPLP